MITLPLDMRDKVLSKFAVLALKLENYPLSYSPPKGYLPVPTYLGYEVWLFELIPLKGRAIAGQLSVKKCMSVLLLIVKLKTLSEPCR